MTIEYGLICFLGLIVLFQQGFYSWQIHKLLDKSMSKSYPEYAQYKSYLDKAKQPVEIRVPLTDAYLDERDELRELNNRINPRGGLV